MQIALIGPIGAGKSRVADILAERTGARNLHVDLVRWFYYFRAGYDRAEERRRMEAGAPLARYDYWKPFEVATVEGVVTDVPGDILDFGGGQPVQDDPALFARVRAALARVPHVVLMLPAPDPERSLAILRERARHESHADEQAEIDRGLLASPCFAALATVTVYSEGRSAEETAEDVLAAVGWAR